MAGIQPHVRFGGIATLPRSFNLGGSSTVFFSSKSSRQKWIRNLTSEGDLSKVEATQVAWAAYPFDDGARPKNRDFAKAVRSHSWTFLRSSKGIGSVQAAHETAMRTLREMSELANRYSEPFYAPLYDWIVKGAISGPDAPKQPTSKVEQLFHAEYVMAFRKPPPGKFHKSAQFKAFKDGDGLQEIPEG